MRLLTVVLATVLTASGAHTTAAQASSRITVHQLGNTYAVPTAINNHGHVVGVHIVADGRFVPFLWTRASGFTTIRNVAGAALDVNDKGEVVGFFRPTNSTLEHGFLWSVKRGFKNLGAAFVPRAINNRGEIGGQCVSGTDPSSLDRACLRSRAGRVAFLAGSNPSFANGINERGEVVGSVGGRPAKWHRDRSLTMLDDRVGYPEFTLEAHDINDRGAVVGQLHLDTHDPTSPVVWSRDGALQVLYWHFGFAGAINSRGTSAGSESDRAAVWTRDGVLIDLGVDGSSSALDINDRGEVVGYVERHVDERTILAPVLWRLNGADRD